MICFRGTTQSDPPCHFMKMEALMSTVFKKIVDGELPANKVYQDDLVTAFHDINPVAPVHILIVPNNVIPTVNDVDPEDEAAMGRMFTAARKIAAEHNIAEDGYRLIINVNRHGGQEVYHVHMHLVGGRSMGPMVVRPKAGS